jgi:hypothetical protein
VEVLENRATPSAVAAPTWLDTPRPGSILDASSRVSLPEPAGAAPDLTIGAIRISLSDSIRLRAGDETVFITPSPFRSGRFVLIVVPSRSRDAEVVNLTNLDVTVKVQSDKSTQTYPLGGHETLTFIPPAGNPFVLLTVTAITPGGS